MPDQVRHDGCLASIPTGQALASAFRLVDPLARAAAVCKIACGSPLFATKRRAPKAHTSDRWAPLDPGFVNRRNGKAAPSLIVGRTHSEKHP